MSPHRRLFLPLKRVSSWSCHSCAYVSLACLCQCQNFYKYIFPWQLLVLGRIKRAFLRGFDWLLCSSTQSNPGEMWYIYTTQYNFWYFWKLACQKPCQHDVQLRMRPGALQYTQTKVLKRKQPPIQSRKAVKVRAIDSITLRPFWSWTRRVCIRLVCVPEKISMGGHNQWQGYSIEHTLIGIRRSVTSN